MITTATLNFLAELSINNNREWFHSNKARYEREAQKPFLAFVEAIIAGLAAIDPRYQVSAKDALFRIHRDTRFSTNKEPYKNNLGAYLCPFGRKHRELPGIYLHLEAEKFMIGGGAYAIDKPVLAAIRERIGREPETFLTLINDPAFVKHFGTVQGEAIKRIPAELKTRHAQVPLIANKQFYFMAEMDSEQLLSGDPVGLTLEYAQAGLAFNEFLQPAFPVGDAT